MPSIFDPLARQQFEQRLDALTPEHRGAWGRLTVGGMTCHLYDAVRGALNENPSPLMGRFGPLRPLLALLLIDVAPWPKGKAQTVREMLATEEGELPQDVARLKGILARMAQHGTAGQAGAGGAAASPGSSGTGEAGRGGTGAWGVHPLFGALSRGQWGRLVWRHVDYHLKQFGV